MGTLSIMRIASWFPAFAISQGQVKLGLSGNWRQTALLVATNMFVGGMIGMERTILPGLGRFQPAGRAPCPTVHPPPHPYRHRRLDDWHPSSATVDLGARLGLDHRRKPVIGRQPRACLVHDGQHGDGPSRAPVAGPGVGLQRFGRFSGAVRCDSES